MPESFLRWDPAQVSHYLSDELSEETRSAFIENNVDGSLLPFLTTEHLRELGIENLGSRLRLKRKINELISTEFASNFSGDPDATDFRLNAININSNYVSIEALNLCVSLLRDLSVTTRQITDDTIDIKKLNENFQRLKTDLNPVIRLMKENKPLPTPTLDPGHASSSPTRSVNSLYSSQSLTGSESDNGLTPTTATTLLLPDSSPQKSGFSPSNLGPGTNTHNSSGANSSNGSNQSQGGPIPQTASNVSLQKTKTTASSPTQINGKRFSSGSVLSVGVGKVANVKSGSATRAASKPRLIDAKSLPVSNEEPQEHLSNKPPSRQASQLGGHPPTLKSKLSSTSIMSNTSLAPNATNQPLKQLKASSDDTCLKVLQHAMKRHHIPREKWSKYVLVVCYGDKERILKLTEKPVLIFKELQEMGKSPAIMLRERATSDDAYEDSRIGDDIPGGTL